MGWLSDTFLGTKPEIKTKQLDLWTQAQKDVSKKYGKYLTGAGSPEAQKAYAGQLVSDLSNVESLSLSALEDRSRVLAVEGQEKNIYDSAESSFQNILNRDNTDISELIRTSIADVFLITMSPAIVIPPLN